MHRKSIAFAFIAVLAFAGSACSTTKDTGFPPVTPTPSTSSSGGPADLTANPIDIQDSSFNPPDGTIKAGGTVTWHQSGALPHTVTFDDGTFDSNKTCTGGDPSKCLQSGSEVTHVMAKPGTYLYYCKIHGAKGGVGMSGKIVVQA